MPRPADYTASELLAVMSSRLLQDGQIEPRYCLARDADGQLPCQVEDVIPKAEGEQKPAIATPVSALP